jgi:hypothetical protein
MKWLILAIFAEVGVLLCLIYSFDGALHSWSSARLTWDHAAVAVVYSYVRIEFSRRRRTAPDLLLIPTRGASRQEAPPVRMPF